MNCYEKLRAYYQNGCVLHPGTPPEWGEVGYAEYVKEQIKAAGIEPGDLVKILRENPKTHKVPIMIYSGSRDVDVVKSILESRPDKYILKGIFKDDFVMEVETMIGKNVSKRN